jgi:SRSO17 transposase
MNFENAEAWATSFDDFFGEFASCFQRSETRQSVQQYVRGLLAEVRRKNTWQLAEVLGLSEPHPLQRVLNEALWEADEVGQQLRQMVIQRVGYEPGIGVIDESGFVKWGDKSAGVGRQYCGRVGKVENCQVGGYLGYVAPTGAAFLDCRLYLPQAWCDDRERCRVAKIPDEVIFQTKPQIAQAMLERVWAEGVPMQWVVGDTLYGNSPGLRNAIHQHGRFYVLAIGAHHHVIPVEHGQEKPLHTLVEGLPESQWEGLCFRMGEKEPIWYEWTVLRVILSNDAVGEQGLVIQRTLDDEAEFTFYLSNAPAQTPLEELVGVALSRHPIEVLIEEAKGEVGMADYEVRHWHGWHRHMTLVLMAHTWLKLLQHDQREKKPVADLVELQPA